MAGFRVPWSSIRGIHALPILCTVQGHLVRIFLINIKVNIIQLAILGASLPGSVDVLADFQCLSHFWLIHINSIPDRAGLHPAMIPE